MMSDSPHVASAQHGTRLPGVWGGCPLGHHHEAQPLLPTAQQALENVLPFVHRKDSLYAQKHDTNCLTSLDVLRALMGALIKSCSFILMAARIIAVPVSHLQELSQSLGAQPLLSLPVQVS